MASDPYAALGVARTATDAEIKKAYRGIAKTSHPDLNTDDPSSADPVVAQLRASQVFYYLLSLALV